MNFAGAIIVALIIGALVFVIYLQELRNQSLQNELIESKDWQIRQAASGFSQVPPMPSAVKQPVGPVVLNPSWFDRRKVE